MRPSVFLLTLALCLVTLECAAKGINENHLQMADIADGGTTTTAESAAEAEADSETTTTAAQTEEVAAEETTTSKAAEADDADIQETSSTSASTDAEDSGSTAGVQVNTVTQNSPQTAITTKNAPSYSSGSKSPASASKQATSPANSPNAQNPLSAATTPTTTNEPPKKNPTVPASRSSKMAKGLQRVDKKDNSIGSSLLFAFAALSTLVVMVVAPAC